MPSRRRPDAEPSLSIFPGQIHIRDRFTDADTGDEPHEWEVVSRPVTFKKGHEVGRQTHRERSLRRPARVSVGSAAVRSTAPGGLPGNFMPAALRGLPVPGVHGRLGDL